MVYDIVSKLVYVFLFLSLSTFPSVSASASTESLEALKAKSNLYLSKNQYKKANSVLTKIIRLQPDDYQNYYKRATANFALARHKRAIKDLNVVIEKNSEFLPGYVYLAKSQGYICELKAALKTLKKALKKAPMGEKKELAESEAAIRKVKPLAEKIDKLSCLRIADLKKIAEVCAYDRKILMKLADCLYKSKSYNDLVKVANKLIQLDKNYIDGYRLLAESYLFQGKTKFAQKVTRNGLKNDPENKPVAALHKKISKINALSSELSTSKRDKRHQNTINICEQLSALLPNNTFAGLEVQTDLCEALSASNDAKKAISVCTAVLEVDTSSFRATKARAKALLIAEEFERAVIDFKKADKLSPGDNEVVQGFREAERKAKQADMKDYYKILGIPRNADKQQIKKAYRKMALKWHPDRMKKAEEKKKAQKMFSDINEANKVLSDDRMRRRYDAGENVYKEGNSGGGHPFNGGFPFQFRDGGGNTFFMHF